MMPIILLRILTLIIAITLITVSILIIMKNYFNLKRPVSVTPDPLEKSKILLPLRLQAYERIVLYLERISPAQLIQRVSRPEMNAVQLQSTLTKTIRDEFEYNLSQQLYISSRAWELVKNAKEETIKLIHTAAHTLPEGASSQELIKAILDRMIENEKQPVDFAIEEVKKDVQQLMS